MQLKILRVMANLTQAEAAAEVGVTQAALSDWENGKYKPGPAAIAKLADVYRVTVSEIVKAVEEAISRPKKEAAAENGQETE